MNNRERRPLVFLFICVFVDMIGYGIVIPLLPLFVKQYSDGGTLVGLLGAFYAAVQAVGGPLLSGLSDRFGRRPVLLLSLLGTSGGYVLLGFADSLPLLIAALALDGMTGGNMSTAQAYIADSTDEAGRARGFGIIGAAFGLGLMVGPVIGGLLSRYGLSAPAFAAAALALANVLFGLVALPESLPPERRVALSFAALNPLAQLRDAVQLRDIRGLLLTVLLLNLAFSGLQSNFPIFSSSRFGWDTTTNAFFFAFVGCCAVATQAGLLGPAQARFGERRLVQAGIALMAVCLALIAVVPHGWLLYPIVGLAALGSNISIPSISSLLSRSVAPETQGRLMGAQQSVLSLALMGGPLVAGISYDQIGMSAPYLCGSVLAMLALVSGFLTLRRTNS